MPYIVKVAGGELPVLNVFGNDYDTPDGTGVRDYIHVCDLAEGHIKALQHLDGINVYNLGTGNGYSVLDLVKTFEKVNNVEVKYEIKPRRPGDVAQCYANASKAEKELGWKAQYDLDEMCRDAWNWQHNNPEGYL